MKRAKNQADSLIVYSHPSISPSVLRNHVYSKETNSAPKSSCQSHLSSIFVQFARARNFPQNEWACSTLGWKTRNNVDFYFMENLTCVFKMETRSFILIRPSWWLQSNGKWKYVVLKWFILCGKRIVHIEERESLGVSGKEFAKTLVGGHTYISDINWTKLYMQHSRMDTLTHFKKFQQNWTQFFLFVNVICLQFRQCPS